VLGFEHPSTEKIDMRRTVLRFLMAVACATTLACSSSPTSPSPGGGGGGGGNGGGGGGGGGGATGNTTIFDDADLDDSFWDLYEHISGSGGTTGGGHLQTGGVGNTDYRRVVLTVNGGGGQVAHFAMRRDATYTPSGDGQIFSITYSEDAIHFSGGGPQYGSPALRQNGKLYALVPGSGAFATSEQLWTPKSLTGVTQDQFRTLDSATDHPDFSATGTRIEFGYMRLSSTSGGDAGGTVTGGIDNWHLVLNR
jgi:hypothetical protein